jgi:hypothetical protein
VFLVAGSARLSLDSSKSRIQSRTWLLIAAIFAVVSIWLFVRS